MRRRAPGITERATITTWGMTPRCRCGALHGGPYRASGNDDAGHPEGGVGTAPHLAVAPRASVDRSDGGAQNESRGHAAAR